MAYAFHETPSVINRVIDPYDSMLDSFSKPDWESNVIALNLIAAQHNTVIVKGGTA